MLGALLLLAEDGFARPRGADGKFDERRSSHFVLHQDVAIDRSSGWHGSVRFEREILAVLEAAYDRLAKHLGLRPSQPIHVWIYDPSVFDRQFARAFRFPTAGFYHGEIRVRGDTRVTPILERVLHHELVHAAVDQTTRSGRWPAWLNEGLSEWFEARARGKRHLSTGEHGALVEASARRALLPLPTLMAPTLTRLGPSSAALAYLQAYGMVEYLSRRGGERSLRQFCRELARTGDLERSLQRAYRLSVAGLDRAFRDELAAAR